MPDGVSARLRPDRLTVPDVREAPSVQQILQTLAEGEPAAMHEEVPCVWARAAGCTVWDLDGREYLDGCSGIFAVNCGHAHPYITQQLHAQLDRGLIHTYLYPTVLRANLLARLRRLFGYEQAYLCTTGSEAIEAALRIARTPARPWVVSLERCFHGKTQGALALRMGGPNVIQLSVQVPSEWQMPLVWKIRNTIRQVCDPEQVAAFVYEPYQGWSAQLLDPRLVAGIWDVALACGALVIADEVQAGMGRTGRWWGSDHFGHRPDLVVCGKALGNGVPIAAVLISKDLVSSVPGDLSATHSGHPLGCAAALATLDVLETERLPERAAVLGARIAPRLGAMRETQHLMISKVAGIGAVWALYVAPVLGDIDLANRIVDAAFARGLLLVRTNAGTVKFGPPLTVTGPELDAMLDRLAAAVAAVTAA